VRGGRSAFGLAGAHAAWTVGQPWLDAVLTQLRANRAQVADFVRTKWPDVVHFPPEATYLAWLDFRALELGIDPQHFFLAKAHVALGEGPAFGVPGEGFARLNFATTPAILDMVLARMDAALRAR
jgi:cystathionine beta-lyase